MALYTMELREIVNNTNIFDFDYPIFSEDYRKTFEEKFIDYFYYREIGCETVARFKHYLKQQLNLIMPYWNKIYLSQLIEQNITDNYDVTESFEKTNTDMNIITSEGESKNLFSDTPKIKVDINSLDYLTNITKDMSNNNTTSSNDSVEKWVRKMKGNIGIQTHADLVIKYESSIRNVDNEVFKNLEVLFMGVF
ncbi:MAG: hypothetical protein ACI3T9_06750 [Romboutsia timonensis]